MNGTHRDALIRAALTPTDDIRPPGSLADEIHRGLLITPQQGRPSWARLPGLRSVPTLAPASLWLTLLLALAVVVAGAFVLWSLVRAPGAILSYHGDPGRTGVMTGPGPVGDPLVEWEVRLDRGLTAHTMPLVVDGTVYVVDSRGGVSALDMATGGRRWAATIPSDVSATPLIAAGLLIVPATDGSVRALDLGSGTVRWTTQLPAPAGASLGGFVDLVMVGTDEGRVHALEVDSGLERWSVDAGGSVTKAPAIEDGVAYIAAEGGRVTAIDAATGAVAWITEMGTGEFSTPAVLDGVLYLAHGSLVGAEPHTVIALRVRDVGPSGVPRERWRWVAPSVDRLYLAAVADDAVYAISEDHNVYLIDAVTGVGELLLATGGPVGSPATLVDDVLYVASQDRHVYAVDRFSGRVAWSLDVGGAPTSPVVVDGRLIVGTDVGGLLSIAGSPR